MHGNNTESQTIVSFSATFDTILNSTAIDYSEDVFDGTGSEESFSTFSLSDASKMLLFKIGVGIHTYWLPVIVTVGK